MSDFNVLKTFVNDQKRKVVAGVLDDFLDVIEEVAGMDGVRKPNGEVDLVRAIQIFIEVGSASDLPRGDATKKEFLNRVAERIEATGDNLEALAMTRVKTWFNALNASLLEKVPEGARPLVQPLKEIEKKDYRWPIEISTGNSLQFSEGIGVDLAASAGAYLALKVLPLSNVNLSPASTDEAFSHVLQGTVGGMLDARMSGSSFFGTASAAASVSGEGRIFIDYFYAHRGNRLLIQALLNDLRALASPFSLVDISNAGHRQLEQIRMGVSGKIQASASLSASHAFIGKTGDIAGKSLPTQLDLSLKFSGQLSRSGSFDVRVTPTNDGWVRVGIGRSKLKSAKVGLEFTAGLTISDIDQVFGPLISEKLPEVEPVIELLDELANPGDWIRKKLDEQLDLGEGLVSKIKEAMLDPEANISEMLGQAVEDAVNLSSINWAGDATREVKEVLGRLTTRLPFSGSLATDVSERAEEKLVEVINEYIGGIEDKVVANADQVLTKIKGLLRYFDVPEQRFDDVLSDLDNRAQELFQPVRDVVTRYQSLRAKVIDAVEGTTALSARLAMGKLWSRIDQEGEQLEVRFKVDENKAQHAFRSMLHGDLGPVVDATRAGKDYVSIESAVFTEYLSEASSTYIKLSVMEGALTTQSFARSTVSISRDVAGNIIAFAGHLSSENVTTAFKRQKAASFFNDLSLAARASTPGHRLLNTAGVSLSFADEEMEEAEIREYVKSGVSAGLLSQRVADSIIQAYLGLKAQGSSETTAVKVELAMNMSPEDLFEAVSSDTETIRNVAINACWEQVPVNGEWQRAKQMANSLGPGSGPVNLLGVAPRDVSISVLENRIISQLIEHTGHQVSTSSFSGAKHYARRLAFMVFHVDGFTRALLSLRKLIGLDPNDTGLKGQVNRLQRRAAKGFSAWVDSNAIELMWDNQIPRRNLALLTALTNLTGENEPLVGVVSTISNGIHNDIVLDEI